MLTQNPWQAHETSGGRTGKAIDFGELALSICSGSCWILFVVCLSTAGWLFWQYPGLNDPQAGPANYWPEVAFELFSLSAIAALPFALVLTLWWYSVRVMRNKNKQDT